VHQRLVRHHAISAEVGLRTAQDLDLDGRMRFDDGLEVLVIQINTAHIHAPCGGTSLG